MRALWIFAFPFVFLSQASFGALVDHLATPETVKLSEQLRASAARGFLFGQQNATTEGVGWQDWQNQRQEFCGDICKVSGLHPALYGWDMSDIWNKGELAADALRAKIRQAYEAGGINTISWHMLNLVTDGPYNDLTPACARALPGNDQNAKFLSMLDQFAKFLSKLKTRDGKPIPLIFRPWHEANAGWFWWGTKVCSGSEYQKLWQLTVDHLQNFDHVHQLIWAYSPNWYPYDGMDRYPGDQWVDVIGFDFYFFQSIALMQRNVFKSQLESLVSSARQKGKIAALMETGYELIPNPNFWTEILLPTLKSEGVAKGLSYLMLWRNEKTSHFYAPYPGAASTPDFLKMARDPAVLFLENSGRRIH